VMLDVLVAGGGPAGCAAAATLRLAGATVAMAHHPRRHHRPSEALPGSAARVMAAAGLGAINDAAEGRCAGTLSAWGSAHLAATDTFASPDGVGWWVDRSRFDTALHDRCGALGVTRITGRVVAVHRQRNHWAINLANGAAIAASWVIDATGQSGALARQLGGVRRTGAKLLAVHAQTSSASQSMPSRVFLESAPEGWWYIGSSSAHRIGATAIVQPGHARSVLSTQDFVQHLAQMRHLSRWARQHTWGAPHTSLASSSTLDRVTGPSWVACGDAASALDPISGQGLLGALVSGLAAAQAICSSNTKNAMDSLAGQHAEVVRIYELRRAAAYQQETRWPDHRFWSAQRLPRAQGNW
jgi:flavin-dependent dehydrogenase